MFSLFVQKVPIINKFNYLNPKLNVNTFVKNIVIADDK